MFIISVVDADLLVELHSSGVITLYQGEVIEVRSISIKTFSSCHHAHSICE